ncbi:D-hexose-6-phosphate mutarotase [Brachymonas denitrificans]|uniref:D-hexose-6-phosphate mutarotase n=1 Tax=Brachymonas denitrificans TaxID=28220 RepID=UPI001BCEDA17|nr:D-hexose-6-phosphate mutarotase [Brachymonas denitrificans]
MSNISLLPADLPVVTLQARSGERAVVALFGAQVLSWTSAEGKELLYLSPKAVLDRSAAIRGGIPVCWPQFNRRGPLVKHGFARVVPWRVLEQSDAAVTLRLTRADVPEALLQDAQGIMAWPHDFEVDLTVRLLSARLDVQLQVRNTGAQAFAFTTALHSYLGVDDVAALAISGADGQRYWDAVTGADPEYPVQQGDIVFAGEVDRVYPALPRATLQQASHWLRVSQPASMAQTVVWNPGAALCASLPDLPADGYRRFVCVEAAQIDTAVTLEPGQAWQGGQTLQVA